MSLRTDPEILKDTKKLIHQWQEGVLGGEHMPEDVHPPLPEDSAELLHYLTLGMCLNYQRNSYKLWEACTQTYNDPITKWVFDPTNVAKISIDDLRHDLLQYKVALQPNKHPDNWKRVSTGIVEHAGGDARNLLRDNDYDIAQIREYIQTNRKSFPYLAGNKICNYWLYVLTQYTDFNLKNRLALSIAPDTHVVQASVKLGLLDSVDQITPAVQEACSTAWDRVLENSDLVPIDVHTPLWLWSRAGYPGIYWDE